jgi:hypothetical protein
LNSEKVDRLISWENFEGERESQIECFYQFCVSGDILKQQRFEIIWVLRLQYELSAEHQRLCYLHYLDQLFYMDIKPDRKTM